MDRIRSPPTFFSIVLAVSPTSTGLLRGYLLTYDIGDLEIEGIVERTPFPIPLEERDPDELTPDELRELVRRSRAEKAAAVKIKQEPKREKRARKHSDGVNDDDPEGDVTVMSESNKRKRTRESMETAAVIDLSD